MNNNLNTKPPLSELLPCPFCGSDHLDGSFGEACYVWCMYCGTEGPVSRDEKEAHELWNRRVPVEKENG